MFFLLFNLLWIVLSTHFSKELLFPQALLHFFTDSCHLFHPPKCICLSSKAFLPTLTACYMPISHSNPRMNQDIPTKGLPSQGLIPSWYSEREPPPTKRVAPTKGAAPTKSSVATTVSLISSFSQLLYSRKHLDFCGFRQGVEQAVGDDVIKNSQRPGWGSVWALVPEDLSSSILRSCSTRMLEDRHLTQIPVFLIIHIPNLIRHILHLSCMEILL